MSCLLTNKKNKIDRYIIDKLIKKEKGSLYQEIKREWCFHCFQGMKDNLGGNLNYKHLLNFFEFQFLTSQDESHR